MMPTRTKINTRKAYQAFGPFSQAIKTDRLVFTSGQLPIDPATGNIVKRAHPNERALMSLMSQSQDEKKIDFKMYYLIGNSPTLQLCLKNSARIGVCSLDIFKIIYQKRFDILGVSDKLWHLKMDYK